MIRNPSVMDRSANLQKRNSVTSSGPLINPDAIAYDDPDILSSSVIDAKKLNVLITCLKKLDRYVFAC